MIGYANWEGPDVNLELAIEQARLVNAEIVTVARTYLRTYSGSSPLTLPSTTYSNSTFNAGPIYGSAATTTYGSQTTYIPYNVDRYTYSSEFWRKRSFPPILGTSTTALEQEDRHRHERNKGLKVRAVVTNSPAWNAGILEGDIIIRVNTEEISDKEHFNTVLTKYAGQNVDLMIFRNGAEKSISVQLNVDQSPR